MLWIEPTVIHIRNAPRDWQNNPDFVYIGRANKRAGLPESIWHNPYSMKKLSHLPLNDAEKRANVINKFADYLEYNTGLLQRIPELSGKILVCYCKPQKCHGDVLSKGYNMLTRLAHKAHPLLHSYTKQRHLIAKQVLERLRTQTPQPVQQLEYVAIVGSRNYPDRQQVMDYVASLPPHTVIVSGGARGVDSWAEQSATAKGLATKVFPVNTDGLPPGEQGRREYGRRAFARNADIVTACDRLVAFWSTDKGGQFSNGTKHSIDLARKQGKPVAIFVAGASFFDVPDAYVDMVQVA